MAARRTTEVPREVEDALRWALDWTRTVCAGSRLPDPAHVQDLRWLEGFAFALYGPDFARALGLRAVHPLHEPYPEGYEPPRRVERRAVQAIAREAMTW